MPLTRRGARGGLFRALFYRRILGASSRIGAGFIGCGLIGAPH